MRLTYISSSALAAAAFLITAGPARAADSPIPTTAPTRETPSAHKPHFADLALWPEPDGRPLYKKQTWPAARVLVWARPGTSAPAGGRGAATAAEDPANWLENGQPLSAMPPAAEPVDIILPDADKAYFVTLAKLNVRHLTIERNAAGGMGQITGNLWIKPGGAFRQGGKAESLRIRGPEHTFIRRDSDARPNRRADLICTYLGVTKAKGGSVEFIGDLGSGDELAVHEGTAIVGPGSHLTAGPASTQVVGPEGVLQLQSGAFFGKRSEGWNSVGVLVQGKLLAGCSDRPIREDATLGLTLEDPSEREEGGNLSAHPFALVVHPQGQLRVHSADPQKARLAMRWIGRVGLAQIRTDAARNRKINMALLGEVDLSSVVFDDVMKGGIVLPDLAARNAWKNVFYGDHNAAGQDDLYAVFDSAAMPSLRAYESYVKGNRVPR